MPLPLPNKRTPLKHLSTQSFLQNWVLSVCQSMLRLSFGLGGILTVCLPTLAESLPGRQLGQLDPSYRPCQPTDITAAGLFFEMSDTPAQPLSALCDLSRQTANQLVASSLPAALVPEQRAEQVLKAPADKETTLWSPEKQIPLPTFTNGASVAKKETVWRHLPSPGSAVSMEANDEILNALYAPSEASMANAPIDVERDDVPEVLASIASARSTGIETPTVAQRSDPMQGGRNSGQAGRLLDEELGILRVKPTRSRDTEELGILQLLQTAQARAPQPAPPVAFLTARTGYFSSENIFRSAPSLSEEIYQTGLSFYFSPRLSDRTSLYVVAETNVVRYENLSRVSYNDLGVQIGLRQRLFPRTFVQVGWRNQQLYSRGYRGKLFDINAIDALISYRSILGNKVWLDSFYQARLGFTSPDTGSRFRQTLTLSLNYGITRNLRSSLIYQLDFDDYMQVPRFDTYHQFLGVISYNINETSRLSVFGGTRFGRSSVSEVNLEDTFYGAGLNVSLPLF